MFYMIKHRPPLVIFFSCLLTLAITLFCFAFYVKNSEFVPDSDRNNDWLTLLKHFNSLETCLDSNQSFPKEISEKDFVESVTVQTLIRVNNSNLIKKFTSFKGFLTLDKWYTNCPKNYEKPNYLQIYFDIPEEANTNASEFDICVNIRGPAEYLPKFSEPNCATTNNTSKDNKKLEGYLSTTVRPHSDNFCKNGLITKLTFYPQRRDIFANFLNDNQKSLIYVHLQWTSYFLVFILLIIVIYGAFQSEQTFDKYIHKINSRN